MKLKQGMPAAWQFGGYVPQLIPAWLTAKPAVLVIDLEEFTPAADKLRACRAMDLIAAQCHEADVACALRIDRLHNGGTEQLALLENVALDALFLPRVEHERDIDQLERAMHECGLPRPIVPTLESKAGIERLGPILQAGANITAVLFGSGDFATDIGINTLPDRMQRLQEVRRHFAQLCRSYGVTAIDGPWPFPDEMDTERYFDDCRFSWASGFEARCTLNPAQTESWQKGLFNQEVNDNA